MSGRVCFIARAGESLAGVRLVGARSEEAWTAPAPRGDDVGEATRLREQVQSAAAWISQRASGAGVSMLCIDVDGSNCVWLTSPSTDPRLVAAAMDRGETSGEQWAGPATDSASIQALAAPEAPTKGRGLRRRAPIEPDHVESASRLAALSVPDTLARLLIDGLDDLGVPVDRAISLWHAMALAWDPASPVLSTGAVTEGLVDVAAPVTGVLLVDPDGRMVWAWSRAGELLAGGVVLTQMAADGTARVGKAEIGRLISDWLSWSVQLGSAPSRIVCVAPPIGDGTPDEMQPAQIGSAIGRGWQGATVDMAVHADPIGATLERLAGWEKAAPSVEDPRHNLVALSQRPGRAHRSMYYWIAAAVIAGAAGMFGIGIKAMRGASTARAARVEAAGETKKLIQNDAPPSGTNAIQIALAEDNPRRYMEELLASKREAINPNTGLPPVKPILAELDTLSFVLGTGEVEIDEISLQDATVWVYVYVPNTRAGEAIKEGLDAVANDHCEWKSEPPPGVTPKRGELQPWYLKGAWKSAAAGGAS